MQKSKKKINSAKRAPNVSFDKGRLTRSLLTPASVLDFSDRKAHRGAGLKSPTAVSNGVSTSHLRSAKSFRPFKSPLNTMRWALPSSLGMSGREWTQIEK